MARSARPRAQWPDAPILIGSDDTFNPKMNNVRKGLEAARRPVVALCDAGIVLDADELCRAAAALSDKVGLVLALKAAEAPENFAAEIERAYINGHQARFLFAADRLGMPVASGGVTLMTRDTLQRIGNWQRLQLAGSPTTIRSMRSVRELGLQTRLGDVMPRLPLGRRDWPTCVAAAGPLGAHAAAPAGAGRWCCGSRRSAGLLSALAGVGRRSLAVRVRASWLLLVGLVLHTAWLARRRRMVHGRPRPVVRAARGGWRRWCARRSCPSSWCGR